MPVIKVGISVNLTRTLLITAFLLATNHVVKETAAFICREESRFGYPLKITTSDTLRKNRRAILHSVFSFDQIETDDEDEDGGSSFYENGYQTLDFASTELPPSATLYRQPRNSKSKVIVNENSESDEEGSKNNSDNQYAYSKRNKIPAMQFLFDEMLSHDLLTKNDEIELASKIQRGIRLSENIQNLLEERAGLPITTEDDRTRSRGRTRDPSEMFKQSDLNEMLVGMLEQRTKKSGVEFNSRETNSGRKKNISSGFDQNPDSSAAGLAAKSAVNSILSDAVQRQSTLEEEEVEMLAAVSSAAFKAQRQSPIEFATVYSGIGNSSGSTVKNDEILTKSTWLTEQDVINILGISGGREELECILNEAGKARKKLVISNLRLVMSISNKWLRRHHSMKTQSTPKFANKYDGDWETPSLDELIQEGVCGLVRAVDKFNPDLGYRFTTYCYPWITNSIRLAMRSAATGTLRVPVHIHELKVTSGQIRAKVYKETGENPPLEHIAKVMNMTEARLRKIEQVTRGPMSIDTKVSVGPQMGSNAGEQDSSSGLQWSDYIIDDDQVPVEFVECSLLRQTLEDAMYSQLSPHERDILRLRLGLDDGKTRTVREITEMCDGKLSQSGKFISNNFITFFVAQLSSFPLKHYC
mmetsp:Transcript_36091/g.84299  ORF Transcript_36091/g.84299 Transcript_36091/m.84299 type:complete len:642 (-) Transcript_36091:331-2256(-)